MSSKGGYFWWKIREGGEKINETCFVKTATSNSETRERINRALSACLQFN